MAAPSLMDELVEEVLLRVPPDDPKRLLRAALVCRLLRRLVSGPGFRRRFREFHRAPPMLGFFCDLQGNGDTCISRFNPTSSFRPPGAVRNGRRVIDSRLFYTMARRFQPFKDVLFVWDPITDEQLRLPKVPRHPQRWSAAMLYAADGACDHLDCHRGPFTVVFVGTDDEGMFSCVYSSEAGTWTEPASHPGDSIDCVPRCPRGKCILLLG